MSNTNKVVIQDSSSQSSELEDIVVHPAFNKKAAMAKKHAQKLIQQNKQFVEKQQNRILKNQKKRVKRQKERHHQQQQNHSQQQYEQQPPQKNKKQQQDADELQVCVQGLSFKAFGPDIRELFADCGKIVKLKVLTDAKKQSKGVAFLKFQTKQGYRKALLKDGITHMDRYLKIGPGVKNQGPNFRANRKLNPVSEVLFIGNLASSVTQDMLQKMFEQYGNPSNCRIIYDKSTGQKSRGYGYIEFDSKSNAAQALKDLNGVTLHNKSLRLDFADNSKKHT